MPMNKANFIRNILDTEVDGLRGVNRYRVTAMYNEHHEDNGKQWASVESEVIDEFDLSWDEIEQRGGVGSIIEEICKKYEITRGW